MSQKSAFPSAIAAPRSRMKSAKFAGSGTGTVLSGARPPPPSGMPSPPPDARAARNTGIPADVDITPAVNVIATTPAQTAQRERSLGRRDHRLSAFARGISVSSLDRIVRLLSITSTAPRALALKIRKTWMCTLLIDVQVPCDRDEV